MSIKLDYIKVGDYYLPNLILDEPPELRRFIGKYADLRRKYLKEHQLALWMVLVNDGTALTHLREIEDAANARLDALLPVLAKNADADATPVKVENEPDDPAIAAGVAVYQYAEGAAQERAGGYLQELEDALFSDTGYNAQGKHLEDYADPESLARLYLLDCVMGQGDMMTSSAFWYIDADEDGVLLYGAPAVEDVLEDMDAIIDRSGSCGCSPSGCNENREPAAWQAPTFLINFNKIIAPN